MLGRRCKLTEFLTLSAVVNYDVAKRQLTALSPRGDTTPAGMVNNPGYENG
jgi:hypothetical protein